MKGQRTSRQSTMVVVPLLSLLLVSVVAADSNRFLLDPLVHLQFSTGCANNDHHACDELCKQDSFWYGYCSAWDGRDFECKCYDYKSPLNATICHDRQLFCAAKCIEQV